MNFRFTKTEDYPWFKFYGDVPNHLEYPKGTMVELVAETAMKYPGNIALTYYNNKITYKELMERIESCAKSVCLILQKL